MNPPLFNSDDSESGSSPGLMKKYATQRKSSGETMRQAIAERAKPKELGQVAMPELPQIDMEAPAPEIAKREGTPKPQTAQTEEPSTSTDTASTDTASTDTATAGKETSAQTADISGQPVLRGLAYGPQSEGATAADMRQVKGAIGELQPGDIAVSPNLLNRYPMGSRVNIVDANGKVIRANQRVADTSWYTEGHPTTDTFEIWNGPSLGKGYHLVPASSPQASATMASGSFPNIVALGSQEGGSPLTQAQNASSALAQNMDALTGWLSAATA